MRCGSFASQAGAMVNRVHQSTVNRNFHVQEILVAPGELATGTLSNLRDLVISNNKILPYKDHKTGYGDCDFAPELAKLPPPVVVHGRSETDRQVRPRLLYRPKSYYMIRHLEP